MKHEYYFNRHNGGLVLGAAAVEETFESSQGFLDMPPLPEILISEDDSVKNGEYTHLNVEDWGMEDYRLYGQWLHALLREDTDVDNPLSDKTIHRAYHLGIGPSRDRIVGRFGSVWQFRDAIGIDVGRTNYRFNDWQMSDFVAYAQKLGEALGRRPTRNDYHELSLQHQGPPVAAIYRTFGTIGELNELIGYPNIKQWDLTDYVLWGADVKTANANVELTQTVIAELSKNDRGPSFRTVFNKFGSLIRYQGLVDQELQRRHTDMMRKIKHYHEKIADGKLPKEYQGLDDIELLQKAAMYMVIQKVLKRYSQVTDQTTITELAALEPDDMVRQCIARCRKISRADIELIAVELGTSDDIWKELIDIRLATLVVDK